MILGWLRRRRAYRDAIEAEIERLIAVHGNDAYQVAYERARDRGLSDAERRWAFDVRRVFAKRIGHEIGLDTATRWLERH
ncbi:MAG: hypothetical protein ACOY3L_15575 [Pseudomonadota bacterium]